MAHFLRDKRVFNTNVTEELLTQLDALFESRWRTLNESARASEQTEKEVILSYIIRFDEKGYRVFTLPDLLRYFQQGNNIERIILTLESAESLRSNRQVGTLMELRLDALDQNTCFLTVTSDDSDWVDSAYTAVQELLLKYKNINGFARSEWMGLIIQITGVTLGFMLSLWAASKISPSLKVENSFIISFLFVLLVFSNTWTHINQKIGQGVNKLFPSLKFYRPSKDRVHWLMQAVVGGIAVAVTLYILGLLFTYFGEILGELVQKSA